MKSLATTVQKQRHPRKPIKYWECYNGLYCIDANNSIAILRAKYGNSVTYKAIR